MQPCKPVGIKPPAKAKIVSWTKVGPVIFYMDTLVNAAVLSTYLAKVPKKPFSAVLYMA